MPIALSTRTRDVGVAVLVAAAVVGGALYQGRYGDRPGMPDGWSWLLLVGTPAMLLCRRRFPVAVAAATLIATGVYYATAAIDGPLVLPFVVALYTAAAHGRTTQAAALAVLAIGGVALGEFAGDRRHIDDAAVLMLAGWLVASIALGRARRTHLAYLHEAEQRAATEERLRIARELHDVLGHNLSLINVQAGAALHRIDADPGQARGALDAIKTASRDTLREFRATLGVLRQVDARRPGLDQLDTLIEQARAGGLSVVTEVDGERRPLAPETDLTAYRLVQEALTNVRRHADARTATVRIRYAPRELRVEVADDGRGGAVEPGNGIRGMSERVRALGGDLSAGGQAGGGFRVVARLPQGAGT
ncbi:sensor histidine kinase [Prauserella oleivorans]|uniref:histidine kinase n=1 Tax=Prauserella oleivorans TaxID=1478153 RepID=A0ABW5W8S0_9PSEU